MNRLVLQGKDGKLFGHPTWIAVNNTDHFYDEIYQDPDYENTEQQDIYIEEDDEISEGEKESLEARTKEGSEGLSEG